MNTATKIGLVVGIILLLIVAIGSYCAGDVKLRSK